MSDESSIEKLKRETDLLFQEAAAAAEVARAKTAQATARQQKLDALLRLAEEFDVELTARNSKSAPEPEQLGPPAETKSPLRNGPTSDKDIAWLVRQFLTDERSPFFTVRHHTRTTYQNVMRRLEKDHGPERLSDITETTLRRWHEEWVGADNHVVMALEKLGKMRSLVKFGSTVLNDPACRDLRVTVQDLLHALRFTKPKARVEVLTEKHANAVRVTAHAKKLKSIALAQAIQYGTPLRQKDVIGEWVPMTDKAPSEVRDADGKTKWVRGLRWNEIDQNLILRHNGIYKSIEVDLRKVPMVMEELQAQFCKRGEPLTRAKLPPNGAVIVYEKTGRPYDQYQFRKQWRRVANAAGVPKSIMNKDAAKSETAEARTDARDSAGMS
jgi:SH3-like domain-containing protein